MRISTLHQHGLTINDWVWLPGQVWCVLGGNGSGKSRFAAVLTGELTVDETVLETRPRRATCVSFETQQATYERELEADDSDFIDGVDHGSTGLDLLMDAGCDEAKSRQLAQRLHLTELLDKHFRTMSSGEARKLLLLQAWAGNPDVLILDDPFEGLDAQARASFSAACAELVEQGAAVLLAVTRLDDVPPWVSHVGMMQHGRMIHHGPREEVIAKPEVQHLCALERNALHTLPPRPPGQPQCEADPLLRFRQCAVRYDEMLQFEPLDWQLRPGQHTLITGPNGAGKSTLLQLISGDHPQCYSNDVVAFGYQRGTGESIWDIKRHIGLVSPALHRDYRVAGNALSVVLSGLYDSIGVYQTPAVSELALARQWLATLGMENLERQSFRELSHGQQRLLLIARAVIKQPALLVLDEPTQGLDSLNRQLVLSCLQQLASLRAATLLFVSHRDDEHIPLFRHTLRFGPSMHPHARFQIVQEDRR